VITPKLIYIETLTEIIQKTMNEFYVGQKKIELEQAKEKATPCKICLAHSSKIQIINTTEVIMLSSDSCYSTFYLTDGTKIVMSKTLKHYETELGHSFVRVHQSHLVNLNHIKEFTYDDCKLALSNGKTIPVSRRKTQYLIERLKHIC